MRLYVHILIKTAHVESILCPHLTNAFPSSMSIPMKRLKFICYGVITSWRPSSGFLSKTKSPCVANQIASLSVVIGGCLPNGRATVREMDSSLPASQLNEKYSGLGPFLNCKITMRNSSVYK